MARTCCGHQWNKSAPWTVVNLWETNACHWNCNYVTPDKHAEEQTEQQPYLQETAKRSSVPPNTHLHLVQLPPPLPLLLLLVQVGGLKMKMGMQPHRKWKWKHERWKERGHTNNSFGNKPKCVKEDACQVLYNGNFLCRRHKFWKREQAYASFNRNVKELCKCSVPIPLVGIWTGSPASSCRIQSAQMHKCKTHGKP